MDRFYPQCEHTPGGIRAEKSCALWIKPVERNRPVKLLRLSMGIVTKQMGAMDTDRHR